MDAKSEQTVINNSSNIVKEVNEDDDKSLHSVKSDCNRKEKEAQVRASAIAMNSMYTSPIPLNTVPEDDYGQPTDQLNSSVMDEKSDQKIINDSSKIGQESRETDDKSLH